MSALLDRVPTLSHTISPDPSGPLSTRPFGLDSLTNPVPVGAQRLAVTVDPVTQLSLIDGQAPAMDANTSCNTESDGNTVISLDTDQNDD
ncbi:putative ATP-grasp-modified RiPP [Streptomyces sp. NPDC048350]|uniref:putative ATP-grasp-modified RiPP n=1 Tax=Streptomyces sp. NPDC048350 TaxID=3365538 RepID=UPI003711C447